MKDLQVEKKINALLQKKKLDVKLISEAISEEIVSSEWMDGKFTEYDQKVVLANGKTITVEWKTDQMCLGTGNLFFEYWSRGKDSGINATTSDYWAEIVYSNEHRGKIRVGVWKTEDVRKFLAEGLKNGKVWNPKGLGGDSWKGGKAAAGWLTKEKTLFAEPFTLLNKVMDIVPFLKKAGIT